MGREARIGLLLGACACLLAVMVDWVVEELHANETPQATPAPSPAASEAMRQASGEPSPSEPQAAG